MKKLKKQPVKTAAEIAAEATTVPAPSASVLDHNALKAKERQLRIARATDKLNALFNEERVGINVAGFTISEDGRLFPQLKMVCLD